MTSFVDALLDAMPTAQARLAAVGVMARFAGASIYLPAESKAGRRRRAAVRMLENGMTTSDVAEAIRQRFGVSQRTAYRDTKIAGKNVKRE